MREFVAKHISSISWAVAAAVTITAITAWGQHHYWHIIGISNYQLFPLFGLLAFSLIWCHYIIGGIKAGFGIQDTKVNRRYFEVTAWVVFGALLLHPSILVVQLFRDGFGLPPSSYKHYVAPGLVWATYLGLTAWLAFMAFELRRWYSQKPWWKYVLYANDVAVWLVYLHGYLLGRDVGAPWLHEVWWFYGVTLAAAMGTTYYKKFAKAEA